MLSLFRTNQLFFSVLLIFYGAALHLSVFLAPEKWQPGPRGVLSDWIYSWTGSHGPLPDALAVLLLFVQGTLLNAININHRLAEPVSLFPGLFYVLFASLLPEFLHLSPLLLANTFYLLALLDLMAVYNRARSAGYIFNAGLWIGLAGLFYFSYLIFIPLAFVALNVLRAFDLRERLMVVLGALTPYILVGLYYFWTDRGQLFVEQQFVNNFGLLDLSAPTGFMDYLKLGLFTLLLLVAVFNHDQYLLKKNIQTQKRINILYWGLLVSAFSLLIQAGPGLDHLLILTLPLSLLLSFTFVQLPRNWAELFHALLVIAALFFQYQPMLLDH